MKKTLIIREKSIDPVSIFTYTQDLKTLTFNSDGSYADAYLWDFGDGNTSTEANPIHTYSTDGSYVVKLTTYISFHGETNEDSSQQNITISTPLADFIFVVDGFDVTFTNTSQNTTSYLWDFGDGNTSTQTNPVHTYAVMDYYNVKLISSNFSGSDDKTKQVDDRNIELSFTGHMLAEHYESIYVNDSPGTVNSDYEYSWKMINDTGVTMYSAITQDYSLTPEGVVGDVQIILTLRRISDDTILNTKILDQHIHTKINDNYYKNRRTDNCNSCGTVYHYILEPSLNERFIDGVYIDPVENSTETKLAYMESASFGGLTGSYLYNGYIYNKSIVSGYHILRYDEIDYTAKQLQTDYLNGVYWNDEYSDSVDNMRFIGSGYGYYGTSNNYVDTKDKWYGHTNNFNEKIWFSNNGVSVQHDTNNDLIPDNSNGYFEVRLIRDY
jgi:PKD repeat protein